MMIRTERLVWVVVIVLLAVTLSYAALTSAWFSKVNITNSAASPPVLSEASSASADDLTIDCGVSAGNCGMTITADGEGAIEWRDKSGSVAAYAKYIKTSDLVESYSGFTSGTAGWDWKTSNAASGTATVMSLRGTSLVVRVPVASTLTDILTVNLNGITVGGSGGGTIYTTGLFNSALGGTYGGTVNSNLASGTEIAHVCNDAGTAAFRYDASGKLEWATAGSFDTDLYQSAANTLRTSDSFTVDTDLTVSGALKGTRTMLQFGTNDLIAADRFLYWGAGATSGMGTVTARAGSIVDVSCACEVPIGIATSTFDCEVRLDGALVFEVSGLDSDGAPSPSLGSATQARGVDTFTANQTLACRIDLNVGGQTLDDCQCAIGVQLDT